MPKKLTTDGFIIKAKEIHGNKYDYSQVNYINNRTNIKIRCNIHNNVFNQLPCNHLSGSGCPICSGVVKLTTEEFIFKAKKIHGDKYNYSQVKHINSTTKVKIIDKYGFTHEQLPNNHLNGRELSVKSVIDKTGYFIRQAIEVHGGRYDYPNVNYVNSQTKLKIRCNIHNHIFEQSPNTHLSGKGCSICYSRSK